MSAPCITSPPKAALPALPPGQRAIVISALGIETDMPFARWRRETEALFEGQTVLRPRLVLVGTSYGGRLGLGGLALHHA